MSTRRVRYRLLADVPLEVECRGEHWQIVINDEPTYHHCYLKRVDAPVRTRLLLSRGSRDEILSDLRKKGADFDSGGLCSRVFEQLVAEGRAERGKSPRAAARSRNR